MIMAISIEAEKILYASERVDDPSVLTDVSVPSDSHCATCIMHVHLHHRCICKCPIDMNST